MNSTYLRSSEESKSISVLSKKMWAYAVFCLYFPMIYLNYLSATINSIGSISDENPTFVTPDGLTFAIWGLIYLFLTLATVYQVLSSNLHVSALVAARPWIALAFVANGLWLYTYVYLRYWLSLFDMLIYLVALIQIYRKLDIQYGAEELSYTHKNKYKEEPHSWHLKTFVFTGFSLNLGWLAVATGANLTTVLRQEGWQTVNGTGGSVDWAIMWAVIFGLIACYNAIFRGDVPYAIATAWALQGIVRMQTIEDATRFPVNDLSEDLALWASIMSYVVIGCLFIGLVKNFVEVYFVRKSTMNTVKESSPRDVLAL
jgi:hypothetical protein